MFLCAYICTLHPLKHSFIGRYSTNTQQFMHGGATQVVLKWTACGWSRWKKCVIFSPDCT